MDYTDSVFALAGTVVTGLVGWVAKRATDTNNTLTAHDKRLALVEQSFGDLKELINSRFDSMESRQERLERKVLNGSYRE